MKLDAISKKSRSFAVIVSMIAFFCVILMLSFVSTNAQTIKEVMRIELKNGQSIEYNIEDVDKIKFATEEVAEAGIEMVDLGLSVKWAKYNLGAEYDLKEGYEEGDIYAYGETETKNKYLEGNYSYPFWDIPTNKGNYQDRGIAGTPYDVATVKYGKGWRMPTYKEVQELIAYCDIEKIWLDNGLVYKFTGPTGNHIYITSGYCGIWVHESSSNQYGTYIDFKSAENNGWVTDKYVTYGYRGMYVHPVLEVEVLEHPQFKLEHKYDETFRRNDFYIEISSEDMKKYSFEGACYRDFSDVGMLWSSEPNVVDNKNVKNCRFNNQAGNVFRNWDNMNGMENGRTYYVRPYVIIGGVMYFNDETQIIAGSNLPRYSIGDIYPNESNPEGVVVSVESDGTHGKIVSFDYIEDTEWSYDIEWMSNCTNESDGSKNKMESSRSALAKWCYNHGTGWYCPAKSELATLSSNSARVNNALQRKGYAPHEGFYWSSTQYNSINAEDIAWVVTVTSSQYMGYSSGRTFYNTKSQLHRGCAFKKF